MSFLTGPTPPQTDLDIVLDFFFSAIEEWSNAFRSQETARKMYAAGQAISRMKEQSTHAAARPVAESEPLAISNGGENGEEETAEGRKGQQEDALLKEAERYAELKKLAARERMAKARAARTANIAAKKAAGGSRG